MNSAKHSAILNDTAADQIPSLRLSPQQRLGWLAQLPAAVLRLQVDGPLDLIQLQQWLSHWVAQHEALRLQLQAVSGLQVPLQQVLPVSAAASLVRVENSERTPDAPSAGIVLHWQRAEGAQDQPQHHLLQLRFAAHGADRGTLLQLAQALMAAFHSGKLTNSAEQDEDTMSYSQYSGWLYDLQEDEDAADGQQFWQQHRAAAHSQNESSLVYRQLAPGSEYCSLNNAGPLAQQRLELSDSCWLAVQALSEHSGYSAEEILMAAWAVTLQRLSQDGENAQLVLNWQHDCRADYEELAPCWGLFSKALPLNWHAALDQDFHQALAQLRELREAASEWQEYQAIEHNPGAEQLRYGFEWGGDWSPIDRAMATATHCQIHSLNALSAPCELLLVPHIETRDGVTGCVLELTHLARCYPEPTAQVVLEQYHSLLNAACQDSSQALAQLPMNSTHFQQTLATLREQAGDLKTDQTAPLFPIQFSAVAARYPDHIALVDGARAATNPAAPGSRISYAELERRSNQLAQRLIQQGAGAETRVALLLERAPEMILAMLAVLKAGAAFLPLEPQQPAARQLAILQQAACPLLLSLSELQTPELPGLQRINLDDPSLTQEVTTPPQLSIAADAAAYVLFTSGSTGTPKGVVVEHAQLHSYSHSILKCLALQPGESSALVTSLAADLSYTLLFPALLSGGCLHVLTREQVMNSAAWAAYQQRHAIDHIKMVPALLDAWLNHEPAQAVLPRRTLLLGGESFPASLLNRIRQLAPALRVFNHYGPTETTVGVLIHPCPYGTEQFRPLPLSQRLDHCVIEILDAQQQPVAPGQMGELVISGAQVARGYLHQLEPRAADELDAGERSEPSRRASGFSATPNTDGPRSYRSGDLARYLPDGSIEIIGRADRQVKIRGFRVELDEIEQQLCRLPGVRQAAVEARAGASGGLQLFAFITSQPQQSTSIAQLHTQLQERLPDYMLPTLRLVDQLPLMANGKLDRNTLRSWAEQLQQHRCTTPPRNPLEALLVQHWAAVLGLEAVGIEDDFFQLGGHSLAAVKLASRLQQALKQPVSVNAVFSAPSVLHFAQHLQQSNASALRRLSATAATPTQALPNLFCFHPSTGLVHDYQPLADALPDWSVWGVQSIQLGEALIREEGTGAMQNQASAPNLQQLAQDYVSQIRQQQAQGPYYLLGWSLGGLLAASAAQILEQEGAQVAFLGIVDSQWPGQESDAGKTRDSELSQQVDGLLAQAVSELDAASQQRLQQLSASRREQLVQELTALPTHQRLRHLAQWAQQAGLHLAQGSWEQLMFNLDSHPHTQALLASFQPPQLNCAIHAWWAEASLNHADFTPLDCAALSQQPLNRQVIPAQHLNILRHPQWQQQISQALAACRLQPDSESGSESGSAARKQEPA